MGISAPLRAVLGSACVTRCGLARPCPQTPVLMLVPLSQVYELPFLVALDHRKESVVVAVRGTMSLQVRSLARWPGGLGAGSQQLGLQETQLSWN